MTPVTFDRATAEVPVVAVLRGLPAAEALSVGCAAVKGGLRAVEITMDSPGAADAITALVAALPPEVAVGAGTVMTEADVDLAVHAGATFLVAPHLDVAVLAHAVARSVPLVPGVASSSELHAAARAGAGMVKLFPAAPLGIGYLAALRGPYPSVPIMASGGVTVEEVPRWYSAGATVIGIGVSALGRNPADVRERAASLVTALTGVAV